MKKLLVGLFVVLVSINAFANKINWHAKGDLIQTTCESGDNITPPSAPAKRGYHFTGWQASDNLFDITALNGVENITIIDADTFSVYGYGCPSRNLNVLAPGLEVGDSVTINANVSQTGKYFVNLSAFGTWIFGTTKNITQQMLNSTVSFYCEGETFCTISNFQIIKNNQ